MVYFCFIAEKKRDPMYSTMKDVNESISGKYLQEAKQIFFDWQKSSNAGLSHETFTACIQTMGAVPELAKYLIDYHGFQYLLSGKLMSDPIEGRFGWYRQLNGGNFFMSVKQLLAEKKIRCLSLLQEQVLVSAATMCKRDDAFDDNENVSESSDEEYLWLIDFFSTVCMDDIPESDAAVCYFVSGYIARSVARRRRCSCCKNLLVESNEIPVVTIPEQYKEIFNFADRGGLSAPTEICFGIAAIGMQCYTKITSDEAKLQQLFSCTNHRFVFLRAMQRMIQSNVAYAMFLNVKCSRGHDVFDPIINSLFNCCAKNELKRLNSKPMLQYPASKSLRKISKLTSKSNSN